MKMALSKDEELELLNLEKEEAEYQANKSKPVPMEEASSASDYNIMDPLAIPIGVGKGATLGLANEAGAALGGLVGATATKLDPRQDITREEILATLSPEVRAKATEVVRPKPEDFSDLLAEYYKVGKKGQSDIEKRNPIASLASNVVGGIATMKMPVLSQLSTLKSAGLGGKIVEGAAKGAAAGGISGLTGEGDTVKERLGDAGIGALIGGGIGGGIPVVGAAGKSLYGTTKNVAKSMLESELISKIPKYFKKGLEGKSLISKVDLEKYNTELYDQAEKMGIDVSALTGDVIDNITTTIKKATDSGKKVDIKQLLEDELGGLKKSLDLFPRGEARADTNQLKNELLGLKEDIIARENISNAENFIPEEFLLTPEQLYKQERGIASIGTYDKNKGFAAANDRNNIVNSLKKLMSEEVSPNIQANQTKLNKIKNFYKSLGIKDLSPGAEEFSPEDSVKIDKFFNTLKASGKSENIVKEKQLERAFKHLSDLPEGQALVEKYAPNMKTTSELADMTREVVNNRGLPFIPNKSNVYTIANIAGKNTPEWARSTANAIRKGSTKASQFVADQLEKIALEPNKEKKNAILFGLMQNPEYRKLLGQHVEGAPNE